MASNLKRKAIPGKRSKRCECCGQYGYAIERHHTRGRHDVSDHLDLCRDCHLTCAHRGHTQNKAVKPRVCRVLGGDAFWRVGPPPRKNFLERFFGL